MFRLPPWLLVLAVWAAIYLPALGWFEIKGEEGRRILPAMTMIESGNYIVPQVGSEAYVRKPPLVNWLVAGSFKLFGVRSEWSARVPSVLCVLAVAIAFVTVSRQTLGRSGSTIAALIWLTSIGVIHKGRLIEIEALYFSLCALAIIFWLSWWQQERSLWLTWTVPWLFLGLGLLAKGPALLLFFYAVVLAVIWQAKDWRSLFHPAHGIGILLMVGIFSSWAIPFAHMTGELRVMRTWSNQFVGRITGEYWKFSSWIVTIPRALVYVLPWLLFLPLVRWEKFPEPAQRNLARALLWATFVPALIISLMPGAAARYALPAITPFCWLMAMSFSADAFARPGFLARWPRPLWQRVGPIIVVLSMFAGIAGYPVASLILKHRQKVKSVAEKINAVVPASETLYAIDPSYQPFFFYMRARVAYVEELNEVPIDAHYFVLADSEGKERRLRNKEQAAEQSQHWAPRRARPILRVTDYREQTVILFAIDGS